LILSESPPLKHMNIELSHSQSDKALGCVLLAFIYIVQL